MHIFTKNNLIVFGVFLFLLFLYRNWFLSANIIGGDWPFFYPSMLEDFTGFVQLWSSQIGSGFGGVNANQSLYSYLHITALLGNILNLPWQLIYKIFWFGLFLALSYFSAYFLLKRLSAGKVPTFGLCAGAFFYTTNTYILMVAVGGQMGVALAYGVVPLVLNRFLQSMEIMDSRSVVRVRELGFQGIIFGLAFSMLIFFDIRIAYLTTGILVLLALYYFLVITRYSPRRFVLYCCIAILVVVLLHVYWLLPLLFYTTNVVSKEIATISGFTYFSFADFSHALSLLHPNWPENIFGKTFFLRPEFLFLPLLAFSGLLFLRKDKGKKNLTYIYLFFCMTSLIAIFFAKGAREPFVFVNTFVFEHVPGMGIFRDATKFYIFTALGYSILITMSISMIYGFFVKNPKHNSYSLNIMYVIFLIVWLVLIWPFSTGKLSGTFAQKHIPTQYKELDRLVNGSPSFFRTLWIPEQSRYRVQSELHPLFNGTTYFKSTNKNTILKKLSVSQNILSDAGVKYVIVPYDVDGEIFLQDRKYNDRLRQSYIKEIDKISWLKKTYDNKLSIYENTFYKDHAYLTNGGTSKVIRKDNSNYLIAVNANSPQSLYFMEEYSPYWKATLDNNSDATIYRTNYGTMRVEVPKGQSKVSFVYTPQQVYIVLQIFSFLSLICLLLIASILKMSKLKLKI